MTYYVSSFEENYFLMEALKATAKAAASAHSYSGRGDKNYADGLAVKQMRASLNQIKSKGVVIIGEGEADEAPMLFFNEKLGTGWHTDSDGNNNSIVKNASLNIASLQKDDYVFEIAVDPLDGTRLCAKNVEGAVAVLAMGPKGSILHAPDIYMDKIAVGGCNLPKDFISLDNSISTNIKNIAKVKGKDISDVEIIVLERERHEELIVKIRETGVKISLIPDGDVMGVLSLCNPFFTADAYFGIGGGPEGVIAAAMLKIIGGTIHGRLVYENESDKQRAIKMLLQNNITDPNKEMNENDMVKGDKCVFASTAVTASSMLKGVKKISNTKYLVNSVIGSMSTGYMFVENEIEIHE